MPIATQTVAWVNDGDGATLTFYFDNVIYAANDLEVYVDGAPMTLTTDYAVAGVGVADGGSVTFVAAPAAGTKNVVIISKIPPTQGANPPTGQPFSTSGIIAALDRLARQVQQVEWTLGRGLRLADDDVPDGADTVLAALPALADLKSNYLGFDLGGKPVALAAPVGTATVSTYMAALLLVTTAAAARTGFGIDGVSGAIASGDLAAGVVTAAKLDKDTALGFHILNGKISASVAGGQLSIDIKTQAGTNPSATNPVLVLFQSAGGYTAQKFTAVTSLALSPGSTLGTASGKAFRLWVVVFNDGGTARLGVINCVNGTDIYPLDATYTADATAVSAGATNAHTFYAGQAIAAANFTIIGYLTFESGQAAAGIWATAPTQVALVMHRTPLPGGTVQRVGTTTGAVASRTTAIPNDDTIPQSAEGDEYMSQAITPVSAANLLEIEAVVHLANTNANTSLTAALFQDATANALSATRGITVNASRVVALSLKHRMMAGAAAATTFKIRGGGSIGATTTFNGEAGLRVLGGVLNSALRVREVMG